MDLEYPTFTANKPFVEEVTMAKLNAIVKLAKKAQIQSVVNGDFIVSDGGTTIICGGGNGRGGATVTTGYPFKGYNKTVGTTGAYAVNDNDGYAGTINSIIPTLNGVTIGSTTTPTGAVTGNGVVYVNCQLFQDEDAGLLVITGTPTIEMAPTIPSQTETNAYVGLFHILDYHVVSGAPVFGIVQNTINSLGFQGCGSSNLFFGA